MQTGGDNQYIGRYWVPFRINFRPKVRVEEVSRTVVLIPLLGQT